MADPAIKVPDAFAEFCGGYWFQGRPLAGETDADVMREYSSDAPLDEKIEVKNFLSELVQSTLSEDALQEIWARCAYHWVITIGPGSEGIRGYFRALNDLIVLAP